MMKIDRKNYEQYFMGMLRIPREREFTRIQGLIRKLKNIYSPNTAVKFRLESLVSKFQSYQRYWMRIMREIEEGRYHRDKFKADMRVGKVDRSAPGRVQASDKKFDEDIEKLHKEYMMARLECNQNIDGLSKKKLKQSIQKSLPQLRQKYKGKDVKFRVVVEGGKAKLKAVPK